MSRSSSPIQQHSASLYDRKDKSLSDIRYMLVGNAEQLDRFVKVRLQL